MPPLPHPDHLLGSARGEHGALAKHRVGGENTGRPPLTSSTNGAGDAPPAPAPAPRASSHETCTAARVSLPHTHRRAGGRSGPGAAADDGGGDGIGHTPGATPAGPIACTCSDTRVSCCACAGRAGTSNGGRGNKCAGGMGSFLRAATHLHSPPPLRVCTHALTPRRGCTGRTRDPSAPPPTTPQHSLAIPPPTHPRTPLSKCGARLLRRGHHSHHMVTPLTNTWATAGPTTQKYEPTITRTPHTSTQHTCLWGRRRLQALPGVEPGHHGAQGVSDVSKAAPGPQHRAHRAGVGHACRPHRHPTRARRARHQPRLHVGRVGGGGAQQGRVHEGGCGHLCWRGGGAPRGAHSHSTVGAHARARARTQTHTTPGHGGSARHSSSGSGRLGGVPTPPPARTCVSRPAPHLSARQRRQVAAPA
jgi:hypothetical protein